MKKISYLLLFIILASCTSNTIFEKPKDLIPRDTMSLLLQEMMIASSAKFIENKNQQTNINYMPFVYESFKIDSTRFEASNLYYMSKIDLYQEILEGAKTSLETRADVFKNMQTRLDSIRRDSVDCIEENLKNINNFQNHEKLNAFERLENKDTLDLKSQMLDNAPKRK